MKTLNQYLTECKKVYGFTVKIAGDVCEATEAKFKAKMDRYKIVEFAKIGTTPVQQQPIDFPNISNSEVCIYNVTLDYPVIPPEIVNDLMSVGIAESRIRVHNVGDPVLEYETFDELETSGHALLNDPSYKEADTVKSKDYYGDDFNKSFLKDLASVAKQRKQELEQGEVKLPKTKQDKLGMSSAVGSK